MNTSLYFTEPQVKRSFYISLQSLLVAQSGSCKTERLFYCPYIMLLTIFLALASRSRLNKQGSFYAGNSIKKCGRWQAPLQPTTVKTTKKQIDNVFGYAQVKA
jgi:hypothetical protein